MAHRLAASAVLLVAALAGCGFNDPDVECQDIGESECEAALDTALSELDATFADYERIVVRPGCQADITCPPSMADRRFTVELHPRDGSELTYVGVQDDGEVRLYTPAPTP